ncbi:hypothetical protein Clacol_007999 [Clathrus columnatus]|uniref:Uncharacterized protein n=1 Tax=Clathrus columnatus TaxID=1419009 RepID=A0AAV5AJS3_9AGAM|nr:hypothetical protein Clacol_007999 [Clathrus columnatus]
MGLHRATFLDVPVEPPNTRNTTGKIHFGKWKPKFRLLVDETAKDKGWTPQDSAVDSTGLRFSGTVAYRALVNSASIPDHPHIVAYPVAGGILIAHASNPERDDEWMNGPWTTDVDRSDVLEEYNDFESEVQVMLNDAYILAHLLGSPDVTPDNVSNLLRSYGFIRKPRSARILQCTREAKRVLEFMEEYASNEDINKTSNELVLWLWEGKLDLDEEVEGGRKEFERLRNETRRA